MKEGVILVPFSQNFILQFNYNTYSLYEVKRLDQKVMIVIFWAIFLLGCDICIFVEKSI